MAIWATIMVTLLFRAEILTAPASTPLCPKQCSCTPLEAYLAVRCKSSDFLKKSLLSPKQLTAIVSLDVENTSMKRINPDLSYFPNLKHIKLSSNNIEHIILAHFPNSLEYLDLSQNLIKHVPEGLHLCPALKEINLIGNPLSCNCDSLSARDALLKKEINITEPVYCEFPEDLLGKLWSSATCKRQNVEYIFSDMQGDEPYEGSGSGDGDVAAVTDDDINENLAEWDKSIEDEYMRVKPASNVKPEVTTTEVIEFEGSGDETEVTSILPVPQENQQVQGATTHAAIDDDYEDETEDADYYDLTSETTAVSELPAVAVDMSLLNRRIKACNFNCSTPSPMFDANETDASPAPGFFEGIKIVADDLGILENVETSEPLHTTPTSVPTSTVTVQEEIEGKKEKEVEITTIKLPEIEVIDATVAVGAERENINVEPSTQQSNSLFIFLAVLLLVVICLVIYVVLKKRSTNRNRRVPSQPVDEHEKKAEEIELIKKPICENDKPNGTHESVPLINGHNENQQKTDQEISAPDVSKSDEDMDVELRPKKTEERNVLTPEAKRVTIKAGEIPNSTPKTPILVTRQVNSDGSIVTTPTIDKRARSAL